ncbi:MAG TPA: drug/metabolite exporter YedA [Thermoanaerobaculia bacterium]|nr:drug/metabolite exporter YedA [Thermoanaerobaculia bacterium]
MPLSFAAVYLIWGSTYLGIAVAIESVPPFLMAGARFLIAGVPLYVALRLSGVPAPHRRQWLSSLVLGLLMIFGGNGLVTYAELSVPSGVAALFIATVPLWMIVLERGLFAGPPPGRATWLGLLFGLTGVLLLVGPARLSVRHDQTLGSLLLLLAAVSWAYGSLASRRLPLPSSPLMVSALQMICGSGFMLVASAALGEWRTFEPSQVSSRSLLAMAYLVLFGSVIGYSAYLYLLRRVSAAAVGTYAFVNPAVAVALGWLLAGESLDARTAAAMLCILGGVASILASRARRRRRITEPGSATA